MDRTGMKALCVLLAISFHLIGFSQGVGINTTSPDSTFSIQNKLEVGGTHGDLIFTDDRGSITYPQATAGNAPMIHLFSGGTTNAHRMILAHSPQNANVGLQYRDDVDQFHFVGGGNSGLSIEPIAGRFALGDAGISPVFTMNVVTNSERTVGYFLNQNTTSNNTTGIYAGAFGTGSGVKRAAHIETFGGTSVNYGVHSTAFFGPTNVALYGNANAGDNNRAGWFDAGDVVIDENLLIGSSNITDKPLSSALLELNSNSKALLLPRMTSVERNNITPTEGGLVVFDNTESDLYFHDGQSWRSASNSTNSSSGQIPYEQPIPGDIGATPVLRVLADFSNNIVGDITMPGFEEHVKIILIDTYLFRDTDQNGIPVAPTHHRPFIFTKNVDNASPDLYQAFNNNTVISEINFKFFRGSQSGQEIIFYSMILTDVLIQDIRPALHYDDDFDQPFAIERMVVTYSTIHVDYLGNTATLNWNY